MGNLDKVGRRSLWVHVLHLDGWCGDSQAEVFMSHWQVRYSDWFVLDLTGWHCLVLVQVKRTWNHSFCWLLVWLVAARGAWVRVLVAVVGVVRALQLTCSAPTCSSPSATPSTSAPTPWCKALGLLSSYSCSYSKRVRVVLPHVFH